MTTDYIQLYIKFKDGLNITSSDRYDIIDNFNGIISEDDDITNSVVAIIPINNVEQLKNDYRIDYIKPYYKGKIKELNLSSLIHINKLRKKITIEELFNAEANTISEIIKTKRHEIHKKRHVNGSGLAYNELTQEHKLEIFLTEYDEETIKSLPTEIDGFKVTYKIIGIVRPIPVYCNYPGDSVFPQKYRPLQSGSSVGNVNILDIGYCNTGTLAGFPLLTSDKTKRVILSNNHVIANDFPGRRIANIGDNIVQPGTLDGANTDTDVVGTLQKWITINEQPSTNIVDCAYAVINTGISINNFTTLCNYNIAGPSILPIGNMPVKKTGRSSGCTSGLITNYNVIVTVTYGTIDCLYENQITTSVQVLGGDSGSLLVRDNTNQPVGLIFAASDTNSFANRIVDVESALGLTFDCPLITSSLTCPSNIPSGNIGNFNVSITGGTPSFYYETYLNDSILSGDWSNDRDYGIGIGYSFFTPNAYNTCYMKITDSCNPNVTHTTQTCTFYVGDLGSINCSTLPTGAEIYINGILQSGIYTPSTITNLPIGDYNVMFRKFGYKDCTLPIQITTANLNPSANCVLQCLSAVTVSSIYIDEVSCPSSIPSGSHIFKVNASGGGSGIYTYSWILDDNPTGTTSTNTTTLNIPLGSHSIYCIVFDSICGNKSSPTCSFTATDQCNPPTVTLTIT